MTDKAHAVIKSAITWARLNYRQEPGVTPLQAASNPLEDQFTASAILDQLSKAGLKIVPKDQ